MALFKLWINKTVPTNRQPSMRVLGGSEPSLSLQSENEKENIKQAIPALRLKAGRYAQG